MKLATFAIFAALATPALAEDGNWTYAASLYGWPAGLDATAGTPLGDVSFGASGKDIYQIWTWPLWGPLRPQWQVGLDR
ncbi:hypothetical protein SAMN05444000_10396 [Shimia gijangensis]|uniref:Uncharacterized protein n=1 Tax=Shimia gijangensis TaxID=1470563 RepID=A0A1M6E3J0_9RHOB|nr:hypothetical protein [Shimia gijangensis]SHI80056.1 hypothetical protein SAMN05444000_10396 [Shimia gijangensis]